jgi:hypothetical protein
MSPFDRLLLVCLVTATLGPARAHGETARPGSPPARRMAGAVRTLDDYRHFRALSIDLLGRAPRRDELAAFERQDFRWDAWIDRLLHGPGYTDRLVRIYMDVLRLQVGPAFTYAPPAVSLRRQLVSGPHGEGIYVYYRPGQRRRRPETDAEFCLSEADSGLSFPKGVATGKARPVPERVLEDNTTLVRPWWLYRDFDTDAPSQWIPGVNDPDPLFHPLPEVAQDPDGGATMKVRVCREEAQTAEMGTIDAPERGPASKDVPAGRFTPYPADDRYAHAHRGEPLSCRAGTAMLMSLGCGCGVGLRHCFPGDGNGLRPFMLPTRAPLGAAVPLAVAPATMSDWHRFWWGQEAERFLGSVFQGDHDLRELLTARHGVVNGPLVQFYRAGAPASCCGREMTFDMMDSAEPLVDPHLLPDLPPWDTRTWKMVPDRGPHAAGLITLPAFLAKFASRRARAAILYTAFTCKSFVAGEETLAPSKEPDLMVRPGCSTCHATLEPLAAYFTRIAEAGWTFLPAWRFPVHNLNCARRPDGRMSGKCVTFYDLDFSDQTAGILRGAYASVEHAAAGPAGAGQSLAQMPEFASCAVQRVTSSFLGRPLSSDDDPLVERLTRTFRDAGLRPRALVRAIVTSDAYRQANNVRGQRSWQAVTAGERR